MKVAMLTNVGERCGVAAYSRSLDAELAKIVDLDVVPTWRQTDLWEEYVSSTLRRLNACDIVHIQHEYSFWGSILPRVGGFSGRFIGFASRIRPPIVLTVHTLDSVREMFGLDRPGSGYRRAAKRILAAIPAYRNVIERRTFEVADRIIIHDPAAAARLKGRGIPESKIRMVPMGVPPPNPDPKLGDEFRRSFGLEGKTLIVVFGFVRPGRGYEAVLDALPMLSRPATLVIAGGCQTEAQNAYLDSLKASVERAGLRDQVVITGYLTDESAAGAMQTADIILCPQESDTGSYSIQVAFAYGRPIIASDLPCFTYAEQSHGCPLTFAAGDARDVAAKLNSVMDDRAIGDALSQRALDYAAGHSWYRIAEKTVEVYQELT
jgi:glycosyltransferase involved in cell wall biosynthesis